ncbi:unnamed protein product, partial [Sphagnum compactum]
DMDNFYSIFDRFIRDKESDSQLDWSKLPSYESIKTKENGCEKGLEKLNLDGKSILNKLVIVKLNGGLGTTMGCVGPKSAIEVRDNMTFLDLAVRQIQWVNEKYHSDVPLILMNSFNTDKETRKIIQKYKHHKVNILTFNQSKFPRIWKENLLPVPTSPSDPDYCWYPPGHGDIFTSLNQSGMIDKLLNLGKEYIFVSNIDNLGATVDEYILRYIMENEIDFLIEVTNKTKADIKGGTIIEYEDNVQLLELAQVPPQHLKDFTSMKKFKIFNTNNIWISLSALKDKMENLDLHLDVISNVKTLENSNQKVIQLETAIGSAIKHFDKALGLNVPRSRFLPVKGCSDLFLIQSDLYAISHGSMIMNPKRQFPTVPIVKLGDHFKKVQNYLARFSGPPHILDLDHLTVSGDVTFGSDVILKGTVII